MAGSTPFEVHDIDHLVIRTADVQGLIGFYQGVLGCAVDGVDVDDPDVVTKSWPGFWDALDEIAG